MRQLLVAFLTAACSISCTLPAIAQRNNQRLMQRKDEHNNARHRNEGCPRIYIGFSTGINNPVGLIGPQVDVAITPSLSVGTGVGISSWGTKTFLEGRYYFKPCNRGWAIAGGITYNTGLTSFTYQSDNTIIGTSDVTVDLKPQTNFMVSGYHFFSLGRHGRNRFHLQAGFSVPLGTKGTYTQTRGPNLTVDGKDELRVIAPGGLILGFGFSFGAGKM